MNRTLISDFLTGKKVWDYYKLYQRTQWFSESEMKEFQLNKLRKLLRHCYKNVPYYKSIIDENHIDISNFNSFNILLEFPLLNKEIIQEHYQALTPLNNSKIKGVKVSQTGGTTGNILLKRNDSNTRSSIWGSYKRYEDWMDLNKHDKILILMGGHVKKSSFKERISFEFARFIKNAVSVDIYNTSDETFERIIKLLQNNNFYQIRAYPQFLFSLAQQFEQHGLNFNVKTISTTSEPVTHEHRVLFKKVFNADVFDQYGCGEIGGIAYECNKHEGLHIAEERAIIETNEFNEMIITDLDNFTMPFIRYWNADQAIISNEKCKCGRQTKLIKQVMGRTCDYIIGVNGQFLHWAYFWHLIFDSNVAKNRNLKKFQIVQTSKNDLLIRLIADTLASEEIDFITSNIKSRLGNMVINFSYESDIENTKTGKYRPVINKLLE